MDFVELEADLGADVPAQGGADDTRAEGVEACLWVAQHEGEVFGDVVEEDVQGWGGEEVGGGVEDVVVEGFGGEVELEVGRVADAEELEGHFH